MSELSWSTGQTPGSLFDLLQLFTGVCRRKHRLFGIACCYRIWNLLPDKGSRIAVRAAEEFERGTATRERLLSAFNTAMAAVRRARLEHLAVATSESEAHTHAADAVLELVSERMTLAPWRSSLAISEEAALAWSASTGKKPNHELAAHSNLLRDIFGNPFRSVTLDPAWLRWNDGCAVAIAQAIYDQRRFTDLPILADALEEAGCTNGDVLRHCREPGEHVRGCWVVDLVLGKE